MATIRLQKRVKSKKAEIFFPDDIVINILSWLPAKKAVRCRLVCRRWRDLTSTHDFNELQMSRSKPMILISRISLVWPNFGLEYGFCFVDSVDNLLLDKWWETKRRNLVFHEFVLDSEEPIVKPEQLLWRYKNTCWGKFSHGGLVVFERRWKEGVVILNPTSHKNVKISLSKELMKNEIYGVFFHPLLKEYCTLWQLDVGGKVYYKMLNLGSKPYWREISNPWSHRVKIERTCTVLIGDQLYWLLEPKGYNGRCDLMKFDIRTEIFSLMQCPVPSDLRCAHFKINLLDIDGVLSYVLTSMNENLVNVSICKLKDAAQQLWIPKNHSIRIEECSLSGGPLATAVVCEQLVISFDHGIYVCNLELGTTRTVLKEDHRVVMAFSHVMSLASLKNCKSKIFMDEEGEVGEDSDMALS